MIARLVFVLTLLLAAAAPARAEVFESRAEHAILIDAETDSVLFGKDAEVRMPPASMAKLMTMAVVFDALKTGKLKLTDEFVVSENAWRHGGATSGGSTMFAKLGSSIKLDDLIHAIIIQSANDGCIIVAEGMAGSEANFAGLMNAEAKKLGLTDSHFTNATGLPDPDQYVTAHDLARLAKHIITDFAEYYPIYSQTEFTWNKIRQQNRNPLLDMGIGADGLKTGYTEESGYGLVGSAVRDGQRLILVVNGTKSEKERSEEARKLMDWGFRAFERVNYFAAGEPIGEARVFGGDAGGVQLVSKVPVDVLLPRGATTQVKGRIVYQGPIPAPVASGQQIGTLQLTTADDQPLRDAPLYAAQDVDTGTVRQRALSSLRELLLGWW
ncbi:MAG TPA: D-alanyl-D-alanine carboxypeptidase family protein [Bauldia sp.]|nr:D-alanyl-D-alanine carboxypeptidase family protein [Bauldia sp.]